MYYIDYKILAATYLSRQQLLSIFLVRVIKVFAQAAYF